VDKHSYQACGSFDVVDERLSASELRLKHALERDEDIASAIEGARQREDDFLGIGIEADDSKASFEYLGCSSGKSLSRSFSNNRDPLWSFDDEEGLEADWSNGPHHAFVFRHHSREELNNCNEDEPMHKDVKADSTLLFGLDAFMTDQEQQFMTSQLISGDTNRLAAATEMM